MGTAKDLGGPGLLKKEDTMRLFASSEFTFSSTGELENLTAHYIKALERSEPLSPEWILSKHMIDSVQAERKRRLRKLQPR